MSESQPGRQFCRIFSRQAVRALAEPRSYERGVLYAEDGRVRKLATTADTVRATARGSTSYRVRLWIVDEEPAYECSCPMGESGAFCKHIVAVALVATGQVTEPADEAPPVDLRNYLSELEKDELVGLLLERADDDDLFDARLRMDAARAASAPVATAALRRAIDQAFVTGGFVDYRDMYDYTSNMQTVVDTLRGLLDDGHAEAVIDLAEHALDRLEDAVGYVDDSDGYVSVIADELQALHLDACRAAPPDPAHLARRLFDRERGAGDLDAFSGAADRYAEVLGPKGLTEYRQLARTEWDALPRWHPATSAASTPTATGSRASWRRSPP